MNRLTKRTTNCPLPVLVRDRAFGPAYFVSEEDYTGYRDALEKLARYEDTGLEPEQCAKYAQAEKEGRYIVLKEPRSAGVHRLEEIARADIEGRLVVLPCKVGDTVWFNTYKNNATECVGIQPHEVKHVNVCLLTDGAEIPKWEIGKTVFLTREDAEKALEGMKNDERHEREGRRRQGWLN